MMFPRFTHSPIVILLVTFFLSSCTNLSMTPQQSTNWNKHQEQLLNIKEYKVTGKIGYQTPEQRHSFNFQWIQKENNSQLLLTTFLGQTVMKLSMVGNKTIIETGDDQRFESQNPSLLMYQLTGLNMPIQYLSDWIKGLPTEADNFQLNELNTIEHLAKQIHQTNWHLRYNGYQQQDFVLLPNSMKLTQSNTIIKIIASNWTITQ